MLNDARPTQPRARTPVAAETVLRFRYDPLVNGQVRNEVAERFAAQYSVPQARMHDLFRRVDVSGAFRGMISRGGHDPDSLAHVMGAFPIAQWELVSGRPASRAEVEGVMRQMTGALRTSATLRDLSDADKQRIADSLAYQAVLSRLVRRILADRGDREGLSRLRAGIAGGIRSLGWDFDQVTLTDQGVVPVR